MNTGWEAAGSPQDLRVRGATAPELPHGAESAGVSEQDRCLSVFDERFSPIEEYDFCDGAAAATMRTARAGMATGNVLGPRRAVE